VSVVVALALVCLFVAFAGAQTVSVIYNFDGSIGSNPLDITMTQGRDGQLYGTTLNGGTFGLGAIFKVTPGGKAALLHSFNGADGQNPWGGVALGSDGNFYGTAANGGSAGFGVIFNMTPNGAFSVLHSFQNDGVDGVFPISAPILASDNNFYGTTQSGGTNNAGAVYRLTVAGTLTIIYNLDSATGSYGAYSPTQSADGSLYIATLFGSSADCGSVLRISTTGVLSKSYSFDCAANGQNPGGPLIQGADGNFYGTTFNGGKFSAGVLFKLTKNLTNTVLHNFGSTLTEGTNPAGGVTQATDGKLYGLDSNGGTFGLGTIYGSSLSGSSNTLDNWSTAVAAQGQLAQHTKGPLYGVTYGGGTNDLGTVFSLNLGLPPFVALVRYQSKIGGTAQILGQGLTGTTSVTFNGVPATSFKVASDTYLTAVVPTGATTGPIVVTTPAGKLKSNKNFRITP